MGYSSWECQKKKFEISGQCSEFFKYPNQLEHLEIPFDDILPVRIILELERSRSKAVGYPCQVLDLEINIVKSLYLSEMPV